jgi:hypothetical protein
MQMIGNTRMIEMKINFKVGACTDERHKVTVNIDNGLCEFRGFDLLTLDQIETLELELTNAIQTLQQYRIKQEQPNDNERNNS